MEPTSAAPAPESDIQRALGAVGEPTRFRIVGLLASRPYTIGELAEALPALQPQTTKHVQALESAGVVTVHRLGRRRVVQLERQTLGRLARHLGGLAEPGPGEPGSRVADEDVLAAYSAAIARHQDRPAGESRHLRFERAFPAAAEQVWAAWTEPAKAARWWAPRHFRVESFELEPRPGGHVGLVLSEPGGASYRSRGQVEEAGDGRLVFSLAPIDAEGEPLFAARHTLRVIGEGPSTMTLDIDVTGVRPEAAPAVAGLEPGWTQLLDNLASLLRADRA